jgi:ketosteroid isomerase-like protein
MSRENVEATRQVFQAVAQRDLAALFDLTDPQVEWQSFFALGEGGAYRGHDALRQYMRDLDEAFEWMRPEIESLLVVGSLVVAVGRIYYRGRGSGVEANTPVGWVVRFHGGRLLRFHPFSDPEQTLEAVGLRE